MQRKYIVLQEPGDGPPPVEPKGGKRKKVRRFIKLLLKAMEHTQAWKFSGVWVTTGIDVTVSLFSLKSTVTLLIDGVEIKLRKIENDRLASSMDKLSLRLHREIEKAAVGKLLTLIEKKKGKP